MLGNTKSEQRAEAARIQQEVEEAVTEAVTDMERQEQEAATQQKAAKEAQVALRGSAHLRVRGGGCFPSKTKSGSEIVDAPVARGQPVQSQEQE